MAELVAKKYSQAIFEAAVEEDQLQDVVAELERLVPLYHEAKAVLLSPTVSVKDKFALVETMQLAPLVRSFMCLLIEKGRLSMFDDMKLIFDGMVEEKEKMATAYIKTAVKVGDEQIAQLKSALEKSTGLRIKVVPEVDESIIGGMVIRIGDKVLDGSVRNKLDNMLEKIREIK